MVKRILAILMVVALLATALVLPIFGLTGDTWPDNTDVKTILCHLQDYNFNNMNIGSAELQTGTPIFFYNTQTLGQGFGSCEFTFTVPAAGSTVWIGCYNNAGSWYPDPNLIGTLSSYYDQSVSYEGSLVYVHRYSMNFSYNTITGTADNQSLNTYVSCFKNVPAGQYTVTYTPHSRYAPVAVFIDAPTGDGGDTEGGSGSVGTQDIYYPMGDVRHEMWRDLLGDLESYNGSSMALSSIMDQIDYFADWGDLLGVSMAEYALNYLAERGALTSNTIPDFIDGADSILLQFTNGDLEAIDASYELSDLFSDQLEKCATVSEALLLGSTYNAWSQKMLILALFAIDDSQIEEIISPEQQDKVNSYYEKEEELLANFKNDQFKANINLNNYVNSISVTSYGTLRQWFDFLMNDSFFKPFIMIPLSLVLVTILLGTRISIRQNIRGDWSGYTGSKSRKRIYVREVKK